jgi:membrane protease YdiL (CAAX protease family)
LKYGLGYFGAFNVLSLLLSIVIIYLLLIFDPATVDLLQKPNPVLQVSPEVAWIMVGFSFLVTGPCEEYLFRGFVFGGLLNISKNRHWLSLALISSLFFAGVHLYYALTYEIASLVPFVDLMTFGMAMAATYYVSGGNLFAPAMIHGAYDATAFIGVATSTDIGVQLRVAMMLVGAIVAVMVFVQRKRGTQEISIKPL